jgi:hypothetical protein
MRLLPGEQKEPTGEEKEAMTNERIINTTMT